ncbi:hypothetical protein NA57DRAFT_61978 [Rhizodiscina lignyota]|uniref:Uncharacterized protein n=1 Tax=Rhizodiscina lignyota TaxID=1504668 RepID=A0A9P4I479_9PEZI|nr:hypothetical protein NA57DRAFT_61978 [Rhizodiscina lignyota]
MAPMPNSSAARAGLAFGTFLGILIGFVLGVILLFLTSAIWTFCRDCWRIMVRNRSRYLERETLRAEWNRAAYIEQRRQDRATFVISTLIEKESCSEEKWFSLLEMTQRAYFPARKRIPHVAIQILRDRRFWRRVTCNIFTVKHNEEPSSVSEDEWIGAIRRARSETDIHLKEYAEAFKCSDPPCELVHKTRLTRKKCTRCKKGFAHVRSQIPVVRAVTHT